MKLVCLLKPLLLLFLLTTLCLNFTRVSAERQTTQKIFLRINQLGYSPRNVKSAIAFAREPLPKEFSLIDSATRRTVFTGPTRIIEGRWGEFDYHAELDFSAWQKAGKYFLRVAESESPPFE